MTSTLIPQARSNWDSPDVVGKPNERSAVEALQITRELARQCVESPDLATACRAVARILRLALGGHGVAVFARQAPHQPLELLGTCDGITPDGNSFRRSHAISLKDDDLFDRAEQRTVLCELPPDLIERFHSPLCPTSIPVGYFTRLFRDEDCWGVIGVFLPSEPTLREQFLLKEAAREAERCLIHVDHHSSNRDRSRRAFAAAQSAAVALAYLDPKLRFVDWNAAAEQLFGWPRPNATADKPHPFAPDNRIRFETVARQALRGRSFSNLDFTAHRANGRPVTLRVSGAPVPTEKGPADRVVLTILDVSAESRLRECLAVGRIVSQILNASLGIDEAVLHILRVLCRRFHWESGELWRLEEGQTEWNRAVTSADSAQPPASATGIGRRLAEAAKSGAPVYVDESIAALPLTVGGAVREVLVIHGMDPAPPAIEVEQTLESICGDLDRYLASVRTADLLERSRFELMESQKLDALGRLAGGIVHDFNNVLQVLLGHTSLIADGLPDHPSFQESIHQIESAVGRASGLTRQLLAFSRTDVAEPEVIQPHRCLIETTSMLRKLVKRGVDLTVEVSENLHAVRIDQSQFEQILLNLVVNASDAIRSSGSIRVHLENTILRSAPNEASRQGPPGEYSRLTVSDTGCGIDQATASRIFDAFFTTKAPGKGIGLGLATVHNVVTAAKGFITVESNVGRGTVFRVYLPRAYETPLTEIAASNLPVPTGGDESLLLIEPDDVLRSLMSQILRVRGYDVRATETPAQAFEFVAKGTPFDLLIVNGVLHESPDIDVRELLESFARNGRVLQILDTHSTSRETSMTDILAKPFTSRKLAAAVRALLDETAV